MKKISIFLLCALGIMAASCKEDIEPSIPQHNPQEPILNAANDLSADLTGIFQTVVYPATQTENFKPTVLTLENFNVPDAVIPVIKLNEAKNLPTGSSLEYRIQISKTPDFTSYGTLVPTLGEDSVYTVPAVDWEDLQIQVFGNSPKVQHAYFRVPVYVVMEGTDYRVSGVDADGQSLGTNYYAFSGEFDVTRMTPSIYIADAYQAVINGTQTIDFNRSDADPYDDPNFSVAFEVPETVGPNGYNVIITYKNAADTEEKIGFVPTSATEGTLSGDNALNITAAGPYKLDVNMEDLTYKLSVAPKTLYVASTGATFNAKCLQLSTSDFVTYAGVGYIDTHFRLTGQKGWTPTAYGATTDEAPGANKGEIAAGNFWINVEKASQKGLYGMNVNLGKMTYEINYVETLGVVGLFTNWGNENPDGSVTSDVALTHTKNDFNTWTGEITLPEAGEVKVRSNNTWGQVEFGKPENPTVENETLYNGGSNYTLEAGTYEVTLNVGTLPYTLKFTKK